VTRKPINLHTSVRNMQTQREAMRRRIARRKAWAETMTINAQALAQLEADVEALSEAIRLAWKDER